MVLRNLAEVPLADEALPRGVYLLERRPQVELNVTATRVHSGALPQLEAEPLEPTTRQAVDESPMVGSTAAKRATPNEPSGTTRM